jgi:hypothetical protein
MRYKQLIGPNEFCTCHFFKPTCRSKKPTLESSGLSVRTKDSGSNKRKPTRPNYSEHLAGELAWSPNVADPGPIER